jgi:lipopolysaccharide O-acetyltransferase
MRGYGFFSSIRLVANLILTKVFYRKARLVRHPFYIRGREFISFGFGFTTGVNCRIESFNSGKILIGNNVQINDNVHIGCAQSIKIGDNVLIASKVFITDHNHGDYSGDYPSSPLTPPSQRPLSLKSIVIGNNVWIGEFVSVLPGVEIGEGSIIGANSVVSKSIPPNSICAGVPARVIKTYNFETNRWERS